MGHATHLEKRQKRNPQKQRFRQAVDICFHCTEGLMDQTTITVVIRHRMSGEGRSAACNELHASIYICFLARHGHRKGDRRHQDLSITIPQAMLFDRYQPVMDRINDGVCEQGRAGHCFIEIREI